MFGREINSLPARVLSTRRQILQAATLGLATCLIPPTAESDEPKPIREIHQAVDSKQQQAKKIFQQANQEFLTIVKKYPNDKSNQRSAFYSIKNRVASQTAALDGKQRNDQYQDLGFTYDVFFENNLSNGNRSFEEIFKVKRIKPEELEIFMESTPISDDKMPQEVFEIFKPLLKPDFKLNAPIYLVNSKSLANYGGTVNNTTILLNDATIPILAEGIGVDAATAKKLVLSNELAHAILAQAISPKSMIDNQSFPQLTSIFSVPLNTRMQANELLSDVASISAVPEDIFRILSIRAEFMDSKNGYYTSFEVAKHIFEKFRVDRKFDQPDLKTFENDMGAVRRYLQEQSEKHGKDPDKVLADFLSYNRDCYKLAGTHVISAISRWTGLNYPPVKQIVNK